MKTLFLASLIAATSVAVSSAQSTADANAANATKTQVGASARDGFTLRGTEVVMTKAGVTAKLQGAVTLQDGTRVLANGNVMGKDGSSKAILPNQLLTFDGQFHDVKLTPDGVAPISSADTGPLSASTNSTVGLPTHDGIRMSGRGALMTRNGVTERITADVRLPNGVTAQPDGTIIMSNGNKVALRADQVLDLSGILRDPAGHQGPANSK